MKIKYIVFFLMIHGSLKGASGAIGWSLYMRVPLTGYKTPGAFDCNVHHFAVSLTNYTPGMQPLFPYYLKLGVGGSFIENIENFGGAISHHVNGYFAQSVPEIFFSRTSDRNLYADEEKTDAATLIAYAQMIGTTVKTIGTEEGWKRMPNQNNEMLKTIDGASNNVPVAEKGPLDRQFLGTVTWDLSKFDKASPLYSVMVESIGKESKINKSTIWSLYPRLYTDKLPIDSTRKSNVRIYDSLLNGFQKNSSQVTFSALANTFYTVLQLIVKKNETSGSTLRLEEYTTGFDPQNFGISCYIPVHIVAPGFSYSQGNGSFMSKDAPCTIDYGTMYSQGSW